VSSLGIDDKCEAVEVKQCVQSGIVLPHVGVCYQFMITIARPSLRSIRKRRICSILPAMPGGESFCYR
jgi:hypothetical protein